MSRNAPAEFVPRSYQEIALEFLKNTPRANLFMPMGLGKTSVILWLIETLSLDRVLIVAPPLVARTVWPLEVKKWKQFCHLSVSVADPKTLARELLSPGRIVSTNFEQLPKLCQKLAGRWPFETVICDESTRLKGFRHNKSTVRSAALSQYAHKTKRWINMTGTPNAKGLKDLWGPQWFIDGGAALGRSYTAFTDRWFYRKASEQGPYTKLHAFPSAEAEIHERIRSTTLSVRTEDWFEIDQPIQSIVWADMPGSARAEYNRMEKLFYAELERGQVVAVNSGVKTGKLLQFASGAVYHSDGEYSEVHDTKIEALQSVIEETGGVNLLVTYQYTSALKRLKKHFPQLVSIKEAGAVDRWNEGKISLMALHPKSAGHGLNLQYGGHHIVNFDETWDTELYTQVMERIGPVRQFQAGFKRAVYVYNILARKTMDEVVYNRRGTDLSMMDSLMQAMLRRKGVEDLV